MTITNTGNVGIGIEAPTSLLHVAGAARITGNLDMSSTGKIVNLVNPTAAQDAATKGYVDGAIPIGGIIMWSGTIATIPSNWRLCNGDTHNNIRTPDLRNRFVIGAISDHQEGNTFYAATNITGGASQTGGTKDAVVVAHNHSGSTNSGNNDGDHTHPVNAPQGYNTAALGINSSLNPAHNAVAFQVGAGVIMPATLTATLGGSAHRHNISTDGVSGTNQNLPPYYALAFIMRVS
jgi:hypothetical protein